MSPEATAEVTKPALIGKQKASHFRKVASENYPPVQSSKPTGLSTSTANKSCVPL